ncbi:hypothetical protein WMY93_033293 [Mugilogobius chulae]|uniref:Uncharacterized protein n=1 Tax=Mugilogobius chulae TaxID=88201 RepID=A0AAW0MT86_9GOBI
MISLLNLRSRTEVEAKQCLALVCPGYSICVLRSVQSGPGLSQVNSIPVSLRSVPVSQVCPRCLRSNLVSLSLVLSGLSRCLRSSLDSPLSGFVAQTETSLEESESQTQTVQETFGDELQEPAPASQVGLTGLTGSKEGLTGSERGLKGSKEGLTGSKKGLTGSKEGLTGSKEGLKRVLTGSKKGLTGSKEVTPSEELWAVSSNGLLSRRLIKLLPQNTDPAPPRAEATPPL